ncbi:MAG: YkvA family protein [Anaerolineales bacterium]
MANDPTDIHMLNGLKARARALKSEAYAIYIAARDPRTPWYAKALIFFVVAHTFSPIDLIPDFIPILGYLDDLIITLGGIWLAVRLIPPEVMEEARATAATRAWSERSRRLEGIVGKVGAVIVISMWIVAAIGAVYLFLSCQ